MAFCSGCGSEISAGSTFCSKCGRPATQAVGAGSAAVPVEASGMPDNLAGMLAYVTFIPAIIFLVMAPYNRSSFIRFHSFQCIFFTVALFVIHLVLRFIPVIGWIVSLLVSLVALVLWILLLVKAYQGQRFKLPLIGDLAEKQANAA
jgi:uncharacterized membrane protein